MPDAAASVQQREGHRERWPKKRVRTTVALIPSFLAILKHAR